MEKILPYLGVEAVYTDRELEKLAVTVPDCRFGSVSYIQKIYGEKFTIEVVGDPDGVVYRQYPEAGTVIERASGRIILYTERKAEAQTVKVPNVTGMTALAANQALINAGLNIRITGTKNYLSGTGATVVSQSLAAGAEVPRGSVVEVNLRYLDDRD
jgi:stage V sporulation protein D (sporulation-specific penicillin-binding protein)